MKLNPEKMFDIVGKATRNLTNGWTNSRLQRSKSLFTVLFFDKYISYY